MGAASRAAVIWWGNLPTCFGREVYDRTQPVRHNLELAIYRQNQLLKGCTFGRNMAANTTSYYEQYAQSKQKSTMPHIAVAVIVMLMV
jgi:hypothetical protein